MSTKRRVSYAQNREDFILDSFFDAGEKGFYVDVGAEAPVDLSVTKLFYDKGWHGINIEPIKRQYELFVDERPRDINLNIGISNKADKLQFREYAGSGYSTFSDAMKKEYENSKVGQLRDFKDYSVPVLTLEEVFRKHQVTSIQFLKVDVEGLEYEVLEGNNWEIYRPEVICIEANHIQKDWRKLLKNSDYSLVFFDGLNEYYTDDNTERAEKFHYVDTFIFQEPVVDYRIYGDMVRYEDHIDWLEKNIATLREENELLDQHLQSTQKDLDEIASLRRYTKRQARRYAVRMDRGVLNLLSKNSLYKPLKLELTYDPADGPEMLKMAKGYDKENFRLYNQARKQGKLLPVYMSSRKVAVTSMRKAKNIRRAGD